MVSNDSEAKAAVHEDRMPMANNDNDQVVVEKGQNEAMDKVDYCGAMVKLGTFGDGWAMVKARV